ncbi:hypothetical protein [Pseudomonas sp.]|uniref:hypothetical protein n=1 Tax=Pseudomonas sp. TaxID=306 RepID=UPI0026226618|nr:hypothetical protein [Pseudomonas sp.]
MKQKKDSTAKNTQAQPGTPSPSEPNATWETLSWFQIIYLERTQDNSTANVFGNGRQQVPLKVIIEARNANGEVVALSATELESITFVNYHTGVELENLSNTRVQKYDYFSESSFPLQEPDNAGTLNSANVATEERDNHILRQESLKWFTTKSVETIRIAASITLLSGTTFHTHSQEVPSGGAASQGAKFNSSLTVKSHTPVTFRAGSFSAWRRDKTSNDHFDVDIYDIYFNDPGYKIRDSIHYTTPGDQWHYSWKKSDANKVQTAYRADLSRTVNFKTFVPGNSFNISFTVNEYLTPEGKATASRIIDKYGAGYAGGKHDSARVGYIDTFGNESIIWLNNSSDGNTLSLGDNPIN